MTRGQVIDTGAPITVPWAPETLGALNDWRAGRLPGSSGPVEGAVADPSRRTDARAAVHRAAHVRDRHQGDRPARPILRAARSAVRRRRRRQTVANMELINIAMKHGGVSVFGGGRTPAGNDLARVPGIGRHRRKDLSNARRAVLRSDDGAAGRAARHPALTVAELATPRTRRAALHRQRVPLHAGGAEVSALLGRMSSAVGYRPRCCRKWARCRSASRPRRRGRSPRCRRFTCRRRLHRPGAGDDVRPRRDDDLLAAGRRARHARRWTCSPRRRAFSTRVSSARSTTEWRAR